MPPRAEILRETYFEESLRMTDPATDAFAIRYSLFAIATYVNLSTPCVTSFSQARNFFVSSLTFSP